jgi:hypothetical protein
MIRSARELAQDRYERQASEAKALFLPSLAFGHYSFRIDQQWPMLNAQ